MFAVDPIADVGLTGVEVGRDTSRIQTMLPSPDGKWLVQANLHD